MFLAGGLISRDLTKEASFLLKRGHFTNRPLRGLTHSDPQKEEGSFLIPVGWYFGEHIVACLF